MQLLPIIIVVSLLVFFIALMLVMLAWHYTKSRKQRTSRHHRESTDRPTRQLTVRSGRVVPLSQALQKGDTDGFNSLDSSSLRSGGSTHTLNEKELQYPAPLYISDRPHASVPVDLEAQRYRQERQRISEKVLRTLGESQPSSPKALAVPRKLRGTNEERQASITESLLKAYKGPPIPGTEPVELPAIPLSSPIFVRKLSHKGTSTSHQQKPSPPRTKEWRSNSTERPRTLANKTVTFQSPDRRRHSEGARKPSLPEEVQLPTPRFLGDQDSFRKSVEEHEFRHPISFFSNSPSSSIVSQPMNPLKVSPRTSSIQKHISHTTINEHKIDQKQEKNKELPPRRKNRPPDINTRIPGARESWLIDSSASSKTPKDIPRGPSVLSDRSDLTCASSEIPTATHWTFGNARALSIAPSVVPQALSMPPVQRPRSKYRRRVRNPREKTLPVLPNPPLSQQELKAE